jgi:hypothetical protein
VTELEYVVAVLPVLVIILDQVKPALVDLSILYPLIGEPPLLVGALHFRFICVDAMVAVSPVGDVGTTKMVAELVLDGELVPTELIADTR